MLPQGDVPTQSNVNRIAAKGLHHAIFRQLMFHQSCIRQCFFLTCDLAASIMFVAISGEAYGVPTMQQLLRWIDDWIDERLWIVLGAHSIVLVTLFSALFFV